MMKVLSRWHTGILLVLLAALAGCGAPPDFEQMPADDSATSSEGTAEGGDTDADTEGTNMPPVNTSEQSNKREWSNRSLPSNSPREYRSILPATPPKAAPRNGGSETELNAGTANDSTGSTDQPFAVESLESFDVPNTTAPRSDSKSDEELTDVEVAADDEFVLEQVYYGTNRRPEESATDRWAAYETALQRFQFFLVIGIALCGTAFYVPRRRLPVITVGVLCLAGALWSGRRATLEHQQARLDEDNQNRRYGNEIHFLDGKHELERGYCWVSVPVKVHERGSGQMELPGLFEFRADPKEHFTLQRVERTDRADFIANLRDSVQNSESKHAFVFIHGYNVLFREAALRTAQLRYDLDFDGPAAFFSWPSNGSLLSYASDEETANLTERSGVLHDFLLDFVKETGAESIHLIAHSMGNRLMTRAFEKLPSTTNSLGHKTISQFIMAAPDVNPAEFMLLADRIKELTRARTLYASEKDIALIGSEVLRMSNYTRLGQGGASRVIIDGVQTIDASGLSRELFDLGHSYYVHPQVMRDLKHLLNSSPIVSQRPWLMTVDDYWVFRDE